MSFIGNLFDGSKGAGFEAQGTPIQSAVTPDQLTNAYGQSQGALGQQQAFVNALGAQNGIGNQNNLASMLTQQAMGQGPNPALAQLNQATGQNVANQSALMASQRGTSNNPGLIARQAAQQGANIQQNAAGQGAIMSAQQQLAAQQQLGQLANQQVGQQQGALGLYNQASQAQQQGLMNSLANQNTANVSMQSNLNNANAQIANTNANNQGQIVGGIFNGLASSAGLIKGGAGAAHGGIVKNYADGGGVETTPSLTDQFTGPQSFVGQWMKGFQPSQSQIQAPNISSGPPPTQSPNNPTQNQNNLYKAGQGIGQVGGSAFKKTFGSSGGQFPSMGGVGSDSMQMPEMGSQFAGAAPALMAMGGKANLKQGGGVPGQAKTKGDSLKNDTVPAYLSPGEIVIPRSITQSADAPEKAAQFVSAILSRQMRKK